jgi:beta-lactamase regulating signal transducer with metallopeptidase domain
MNAVVSALAPFQSFASVLVAYLVMVLVVGTAIAALAALIVRFCKPLDAAARYAVWCVALIAVALGPLATTVAMQHALRGPSDGEIAAAMKVMHDAKTPVRIEIRFPRPMLAIPPALADGVAALWLLVVLVGLVRFGAGVAVLARLKRDALPLAPERRAALPLWIARAGARRVRLCVSDRIDVPVAVGLFDGMVVLPQHVLDTFDPSDVDRFVVHELAHLERRDDWTSCLERLLQVALFFHPVVHMIAHRLDLEREIACDDRVVAATADVRSYAIGLTRMAEATAWPHSALAAPAIFVTRKQLSLRVEELLARRRFTAPRAAILPAALALASALGVVALAMPLAPRVTVGVDGQRALFPHEITRIQTKKFVLIDRNGKKTTLNEQTAGVLMFHADAKTLSELQKLPGVDAPHLQMLLKKIQAQPPTR